MTVPQADKGNAIAEKIEDITRLYLLSEPEEQILPLVDEAFALLGDNVEHICQLLEFLPRALTGKKFIAVLEKEKSRRSAQVAKANLTALSEVKLTVPEKRKLYLLMHECLSCDTTCTEDAHRMLVMYLSTFTKAEEFTAELEEKCCLAILNILKQPIWQFDEVSDLAPVRALGASKTPANKQLFFLLDTFCTKGINEYQSWYATNRDLVEKTWGLSPDNLLEKIRLLSLLRLAQDRKASQGTDAVLAYREVATVLNINEDEVEPLVIRAVGLKLLGCRLDPIKKTVKIGYIHHVMFTIDQWKQLQETLGGWKTNIANLRTRFEEISQKRAAEGF